MLWKGFAFDHFWNGETYQVINYHTTFSHISFTLYDRNAASVVILKRISIAKKRTRIYGEFLQSHQKFKTQFYTSFCRTSRALYHHSILCSFFRTDLYLDCVENFLSLFYMVEAEKIGHCVTHWILFCSLAKISQIKSFISYSSSSKGRARKMISIFFTSEWMTCPYRERVRDDEEKIKVFHFFSISSSEMNHFFFFLLIYCL
jgi:hypothetical protein